MTTREWRDYLNDIIAYAEAALQIAAQAAPGDGMEMMRRLALERALEVIGEASSKIPVAVRRRYPEIPWPQMSALRHRLAHGYFSIDAERLTRIVQEELPMTLDRLRAAARAEGTNAPPTD